VLVVLASCNTFLQSILGEVHLTNVRHVFSKLVRAVFDHFDLGYHRRKSFYLNRGLNAVNDSAEFKTGPQVVSHFVPENDTVDNVISSFRQRVKHGQLYGITSPVWWHFELAFSFDLVLVGRVDMVQKGLAFVQCRPCKFRRPLQMLIVVPLLQTRLLCLQFLVAALMRNMVLIETQLVERVTFST